MIFERSSRNKVTLLLLVLALILLGLVIAFIPKKQTDNPETVACTLEAKICPDGTAVGRVGPQCEFAACPNVGENWPEYLDLETGISFRYPQTLTTRYITAVDWPPTVFLSDDPYSCAEAGEATARAGITERKFVFGNEYCVTTVSEGAAGSVYDQYAYARSDDAGSIIMTLSVRKVQCSNYDEPQKTECEAERSGFDLDSLINQIFSTLERSN